MANIYNQSNFRKTHKDILKKALKSEAFFPAPSLETPKFTDKKVNLRQYNKSD